GIIFGLIPAFQASHPNLNEALKESTASSAGRAPSQRRLSTRTLLVAGQITLSFVLLASAGLLVKSLLRLQAINLGFSPAGITSMSLEGRGVKQQFYEQLLARVQQMPGIESASVASTAPLLGHNSITIMEIKGQPENHDAGPPAVGLNVISPNYFSTLGIHL